MLGGVQGFIYELFGIILYGARRLLLILLFIGWFTSIMNTTANHSHLPSDWISPSISSSSPILDVHSCTPSWINPTIPTIPFSRYQNTLISNAVKLSHESTALLVGDGYNFYGNDFFLQLEGVVWITFGKLMDVTKIFFIEFNRKPPDKSSSENLTTSSISHYPSSS